MTKRIWPWIILLALIVGIALRGRTQNSTTGRLYTNAYTPVYNATNPTYGGVADYRTVADGVCSNSANTWSSATLAMTQADVGRNFWARPSANNTTILDAAGLSQFTVGTVTNATNWTSTVNSGGSNCGSSMKISIGTDLGAALNAAWTAGGFTSAATATAGRGTIYIPCGEYAMSTKPFQSMSASAEVMIVGCGQGGTTASGVPGTFIHVSPGIGWNASTVTIQMNGTVHMRDVVWDGDQFNQPAKANAGLIGFGGVATMMDVSFSNFNTATSTQVLCQQSGDDFLAIRMFCRFAGGTAFQAHTLHGNLLDCVFFGAPGMEIADFGSIATVIGGDIGGIAGGNALLADAVSGGGTGVSFIGTSFAAGNNSVPIISVTSASITDLKLINPVFDNSGLNNVNLLTNNGGTLTVSGLSTKGSGTGMTVTNTSGTIRDGCGDDMTNVTSTGAILGWCGSSGIAKPCAAAGSAASPSIAACGNSTGGLVSCATNAVTDCTVNSTSVTATSVIHIQQDSTTTTGTALSVTCNTTAELLPQLVTKTAGSLFDFKLTQPVSNPACYSWFLGN